MGNLILNNTSPNKLIISAANPNKLLISQSIMGYAVAWYDASVPSSFTLDVSDNVEIWHDLSGNGYDIAQTTESKRPLYESVNERVYFHRSSSEGLLNPTNPNLSQPLTTVQLVEGVTDGINQIVLYGAGFRQSGTWLQNGGNFYFQDDGNTQVTKDGGGNITWVKDKKYIIIYRWDGASTRAYINEIGGYGSPGDNGLVGLRMGYGHYGDYLDGYVYEAAVFDWFLSSEEEQAVSDYLQVKWNVTIP